MSAVLTCVRLEVHSPVSQGYQTHFHQGHISLEVAFKALNVLLGLYKCNYSLTVTRELSAAAGQKQGARGVGGVEIKQGGGPAAGLVFATCTVGDTCSKFAPTNL